MAETRIAGRLRVQSKIPSKTMAIALQQPEPIVEPKTKPKPKTKAQHRMKTTTTKVAGRQRTTLAQEKTLAALETSVAGKPEWSLKSNSKSN